MPELPKLDDQESLDGLKHCLEACIYRSDPDSMPDHVAVAVYILWYGQSKVLLPGSNIKYEAATLAMHAVADEYSQYLYDLVSAANHSVE